jgi:hypothetical protein
MYTAVRGREQGAGSRTRNLRKFGGVAAVGRETVLPALGGGRCWGEAGAMMAGPRLTPISL